MITKRDFLLRGSCFCENYNTYISVKFGRILRCRQLTIYNIYATKIFLIYYTYFVFYRYPIFVDHLVKQYQSIMISQSNIITLGDVFITYAVQITKLTLIYRNQHYSFQSTDNHPTFITVLALLMAAIELKTTLSHNSCFFISLFLTKKLKSFQYKNLFHYITKY